MRKLNVSRLTMVMALLMAALVVAACSPASPTPAGDLTADATTAASEPMSSTGAAAAVEGFYEALFSGGDAAAFVCASADAAEVQQIHRRVADAYEGATIDTSALTFEAGETEPGKALVMINGSLSADAAGVKTEIPVVVPPVSVSLEGDSWKICPAS